MVTRFVDLGLNNTLGVMLIGVIFSAVLFGLTTLQTYIYYVTYTKDRAAFKWLVGVVWILDCLQTVFISHSIYYFLVDRDDEPYTLLQSEWSMISAIPITFAVAILVQCFWAHRVYKLGRRNRIVPICIVLLSVAEAGLGIVATVRIIQPKLFPGVPETNGIMSAALLVMAVNDVLVTFALCYFLRKSQTAFIGTHDVIQIIMIYTIETGFLTSLVVTIDAICILTMPGSWDWIGVGFCISKMYANSLLAMLNSRRFVQDEFGKITTPLPNAPAYLNTSRLTTSERIQGMSNTDMQQKYADAELGMQQFKRLPTLPA